jgi:molybdopterin-guanine dinucleotide biosynthesis protein A
MGRDKSRLPLGKRTMLGEIRAIARATGWPVRVIHRDLVPRCGPLGGIYTGLRRSRASLMVFLACDMPFVTVDLLRLLPRRFRRPAQARFVQSAGAVGFPCLLRRTVAPAVLAQIESGNHSIQALAEALQAETLRLPRSWDRQLQNVNTPKDWDRARRCWAAC